MNLKNGFMMKKIEKKVPKNFTYKISIFFENDGFFVIFLTGKQSADIK